MSSLYFAPKYKNMVINLLLKNKDFIKVINPERSKCEDLDIIDVLLGGSWIIDGERYEEQGHIFDYDFVDDTVTQEKTFVFVDTYVDSIRDNLFVDFTLMICVFTSKDLVKLNDKTVPTVDQIKEMGHYVSRFGNRIDTLCTIIDNTINGTDQLPSIGNIQPSKNMPVSRYSPSSKYYGKCLKYKLINCNEGGDYCNN